MENNPIRPYCLMIRPKEARAPAVFTPVYWYETLEEASHYLQKLGSRNELYQYEILMNFPPPED
jgi:hypothetical protein